MACFRYIALLVVLLMMIDTAYGFLLPLVVPYPDKFQVIAEQRPIFLPRASMQNYIPTRTYHSI